MKQIKTEFNKIEISKIKELGFNLLSTGSFQKEEPSVTITLEKEKVKTHNNYIAHIVITDEIETYWAEEFDKWKDFYRFIGSSMDTDDLYYEASLYSDMQTLFPDDDDDDYNYNEFNY